MFNERERERDGISQRDGISRFQLVPADQPAQMVNTDSIKIHPPSDLSQAGRRQPGCSCQYG